VGASVGSSFIDPWLVGTLHGTIAPFRNSFLELGVDLGLLSGVPDVGYYSFNPFMHLCYFSSLSDYRLGVYAGAGGSFIWASYDFPEGELTQNTFTADAVAGVTFFDMILVSYTFRTNFTNVSNKVSVGYTHRFK
jgi:hypothetical protein